MMNTQSGPSSHGWTSHPFASCSGAGLLPQIVAPLWMVAILFAIRQPYYPISYPAKGKKGRGVSNNTCYLCFRVS